MKNSLVCLAAFLVAVPGVVCGAEDPTYTNFIRQIQLPNVPNGTVAYINNIASTDTRDSPLPINPNGASFELWTVRSAPLAQYLLESRYVGTFVPVAQVVLDTEDWYGKKIFEPGEGENVSFANPDFMTAKKVPINYPGVVRRTRADRPFKVYLTTSGLLTGETAPTASKSVNFLRHLQSYGPGGIGHELDRTQAILNTQSSITTNGTVAYTFALNSVPGADRSKVRGEERYSVFSIYDNAIPSQPIQPSQLTSETVKIWPVATASVTAIAQDQLVRFAMPKLTFTYTDTYPGSATYAQVYRGEPQLGKTGIIVPGSHRLNTTDHAENYTEMTGGDLDLIFDGDGRWTMEILTETPFGIDRLSALTFTLDRTIEVNGNLSTVQ